MTTAAFLALIFWPCVVDTNTKLSAYVSHFRFLLPVVLRILSFSDFRSTLKREFSGPEVLFLTSFTAAKSSSGFMGCKFEPGAACLF